MQMQLHLRGDPNTDIPVKLQVGLAFFLAVGGGAISALAGVSHRRLCVLISLAAGTLLGVTLLSILPESARGMPWWTVVLAFASGYWVFSFISAHVFHVCPACAASHFDEATTHRFGEIALALLIALGIHSSLDGVALAAGHEAGGRLDASLILAICVHKLPEGLALGALLLGAGFPKLRAVAWVAAAESTTLLGGAMGSWLLPGATPVWLNLILAHVGGGFIFLAVHAVLGELVRQGERVVLATFAAGLTLIALLNLTVRFL